jgi:hypothetical protein
MPRYPRKFNASLKRAFMLAAIPLALTSTGYALFSQQLSVNATGNVPNYTSSQYLSVSYTQTSVQSGSNWIITTSVTIKDNSGTRTASAWESTFDLPSGYSSLSCSNATCSQANNVNTAVNTGTNGTINPGGTVTYSFSFTYSQPSYKFTAITVSGTIVPIYQTISGLTVTAVAGTRVKNKNVYQWPYTITVTNNSGQDLAGWEILIPWAASNNVVSMPVTVNYTTTSTQLTITSKQAINNGTSFQFLPTLGSTNSGWTMSGQTVLGDHF